MVDHVKARLQWALAHKDWTVEDFQRVIYSDECSWSRFRQGISDRFFRHLKRNGIRAVPYTRTVVR